VGVAETMASKWNLYPNPANDQFTLTTDVNMESIHVVDMMGKTVFQNNNIQSSIYVVNTTTWETGLYYVTITNRNGRTSKSVIIE